MTKQKFIAEFIGTFALVFCGTGAVIIDEETGGMISHAGVAITFGLIVMSMIYTVGRISGAHLNPAVSIAFTISGRFRFEELLPYIFSQIAGAIAASGTLRIMFPENLMLGTTVPAGDLLQSFILEFLLTFFLMMVIINVATGNKEQGQFAGVVIGSMVALEAMFAGPISGASMNPARSAGPAIVSGQLEHVWIYLVAPVLGAASAVPVCKFLLRDSLNDRNEQEKVQASVNELSDA